MATYFDISRPFINQDHFLIDILATGFIIAPFERIKILLQTSHKNENLKIKKKIFGRNFQVLKTLIKNEGIISLWRGLPLTILSLSLYSKIPYGENMKNIDEFISYSNLKQHNNKPLFEVITPTDFNSSVLGTIINTTFCFSVIYHPLSLIKYNQMFNICKKGNKSSSGIFATTVKIYRRKHNITSFYQGFLVNYFTVLTSTFLILGANARYERFITEDNTDEIIFLKIFNFFNFSLFYFLDSYAKNRMIFSDLDSGVYKGEKIWQYKDHRVSFKPFSGVKNIVHFIKNQGFFGVFKGWSSMMMAMGLIYSIDRNFDHIQDKTQNWI